MKAVDILPKLSKVKKTSSGWLALCPAHQDKTQSLSLSDADGKVLLKCFAGCDAQNIVSALGIELKDLFAEPKRAANNFQSKKIVAVYDYADEHGEILYQNVRYEPKDFRQRKPNGRGDGFDYSLNGARRVPYSLPELIEAVKRGSDVWLCEGEKDADNLRTLGLASTSFKNWKSEFNALLKSSHVCLIQDHDKAGIKQANDACKLLSSDVASLKTLDLFQDEPLPEKHGKDFSDWFENEKQNGLSDEEIAEKLCIFTDNADAWQPISADAESISDFEEIKIKPFPVPNEKCFYGLAGEFVRVVEPHTEASPMALLAQFLVYFGNIIGRTAHFKIEGDKHYTNLFCVLIGNTASGRKGTSLGRVKQIFEGIDAHHEKECIASGLASGEGLLYRVRNAQYTQKKNKETGEIEDVLFDGGVTDKRLLTTEGEFAQVLRVQGREGNTLSSFIRNLWDHGTAQSMTKNSPLKTTDAHVSVIGHITKAELLVTLTEVESANGYANRFLFIAVDRAKLLPFGSDFSNVEIGRLQDKLSDAIEFAKQKGAMNFSIEASELWASVYERLETSRFGYLAKLTQRASPYVLRLSLIFALLDKSPLIEKPHLEAALAVWQYSEDSARYVFGERLDNQTAEKILAELKERSAEGMTRSEIRNFFDRHISNEKLNAALALLLENKLAEPKKQETKGRSKEIWFPCVKSVKSVESEDFSSADQTFNAFNAFNAKMPDKQIELCPECRSKLSPLNSRELLCNVCLYTKAI